MKSIARYTRVSTSTLLAALGVLTVGLTLALAADWPQWALNPQHTSEINVAGQSLNRNIDDVVYDPTVPAEQAINGGDLLVHYQVPLIENGDDEGENEGEDTNVYMEFKSGTPDANTFSLLNWSENKLTWQNGSLVQVWSFASDWKAPGSYNEFWQPVFHAALANGSVYVPGAGGTIFRVNRTTGIATTRINPFGTTIDSNTFTAGPLSVDSSGNIFYNVVQLPAGQVGFFDGNPVDSWLVKVTPGNTVTKVSYSVLTAGAPGANAQCLGTFDNSTLPWPPSHNAVPPSFPCGLQRVALNIAPAIAPNGTIYSISRAHFNSRYGYVVAVNPNLTQKWIASLRERFSDGCGVSISQGGSLPPNGSPGGCRSGAKKGVDPATNGVGGGRVLDDSSSSPTVAPDGSVLYGAYSRYNYAQGHMMQFSSTGQFLHAYRFGWDQTPGIYSHGGTYSVVIKDNQYSGLGSYCNDDGTFCPTDRTATNPAYPEAYFVTQLNNGLGVDWRFQNTNTLSCTRQPNGSVTCVDDHPNSFEWCVNAPVIDKNGVVYANSEDGNLFAINQGGTLKQKIFQQLALGAAYTPASMGGDGKIYSQNDGHLFVVGH